MYMDSRRVPSGGSHRFFLLHKLTVSTFYIVQNKPVLALAYRVAGLVPRSVTHNDSSPPQEHVGHALYPRAYFLSGDSLLPMGSGPISNSILAKSPTSPLRILGGLES